jgi:hypothetical protein
MCLSCNQKVNITQQIPKPKPINSGLKLGNNTFPFGKATIVRKPLK